jgi:hypothetical protein
MERLIQFNLTRENLPLQFQWPVLSPTSFPCTPPEVEMKVVTIAPAELLELPPCEQEQRLGG